MIESVFNIVFTNVMPYVAPIVMLLASFIVANELITLISRAFLVSDEAQQRRDRY